MKVCSRNRVATHLALGLGAAALVTLAPGARPAAAQPDAEVGAVDIEVPALIVDLSGDVGSEGDEELDLANVVQSAARGVTTVQEAPTIVTVITSDEIEERQTRKLLDVIDTVPGYMGVGLIHDQFPHPSVRGQIQASQFLHDGVSMFDPFVNVAAFNEVQPLELVKRVELITGPGGPLWGSNSLLGIVNVITKDAEDLVTGDDDWGAEVGIRAGDGDGNPQYLDGYVMAGKTNLFSSDSKLLVHGSFKTFYSPAFQMSQHMFSAPLPQPNSPVLYGPLTEASPPRTFMFSLFAKLTMGKTKLRVFAPFMERHLSMGFPGIVIREHLAEDDRPECQAMPDVPVVPNDGCSDKLKAARDDHFNAFDRYAVLEYTTRLSGGKAGFTAKLYGTEFVRDFQQIQVLAPIEGLLEGGLAFGFNGTTYRTGAAVDGDVELGSKARLLYGAEAFREFARNDVTRSRQGDGQEATFIGPYELSRLPLPCPRERDPDQLGSSRFIAGCPVTFAFPSSRTVFGVYASPQVRPNKKLILDAGARVQVAPEALGVNSYDPTATFSASAVYNFIPAWHLKLNLAQGFRPPVFNNLNSNGEAVQIGGRKDLEVETTDAAQGEINARIFKGDRRIRELNFRVDYSYTRVQNLIQIQAGQYANTADRGIHSVEFLGKLYVQGGHRIELGYTWLVVNTADKGRLRAMPEHWFNLLGVFNIVDDKLRATTNFRILGAQEDANRMVEHRNLHYCQPGEAGCTEGNVVNSDPSGPGYVRTLPFELVMDRIPPSAELTVGLTWMATKNLALTAEAFNALNGRYYQPDLFADYEPRLEFLPNPHEDLRVYVGADYKY